MQEAGQPGDADRLGERGGGAGVLVVAADEDDAWPGSTSQASFEPKPARSAVMLTEPGMCASSNWSSVRTSTTSAPSRRGLVDLARGERVDVDAVARPAGRG